MAVVSIKPTDFIPRIGAILGATGTTSNQLMASLAKIEMLYNEVAALTALKDASDWSLDLGYTGTI
jgi:hypothetical protein